jgi:hypothetical protein
LSSHLSLLTVLSRTHEIVLSSSAALGPPRFRITIAGRPSFPSSSREPVAAAEEASLPTLSDSAIEDTVIDAARTAYGECLEMAAYIRQSERYFRDDVTRLGLYVDQEIKRENAEILFVEVSAILTEAETTTRHYGDG